MRLVNLEYSEYAGLAEEWSVEDLSLGAVNLIVGKNASGKTRTLNAISTLASLLSEGHRIPPHIHFRARFEGDHGESYTYTLESKDGRLENELLEQDGEVRLERGKGGKGKIYAVPTGTLIDVETPESIAAATRTDSIQHPFLAPINRWAAEVFDFPFAEYHGQCHYYNVVEDPSWVSPFNPRDAGKIVHTYLEGVRSEDFGPQFKKSVLEAMGEIGYRLDGDGIRFASPEQDMLQQGRAVVVPPLPFGKPHILLFKESDLHFFLPQTALSQGMFRAFASIVYVEYAVLSGQASCILIDDIGEGLDFERSSKLIKLLDSRVEDSPVQLVMSTNDRFVMNSVPLDKWSVLERKGGSCRVKNYRNSRDTFERFKFTGLNNFDFLAVDFLNAEVGAHE